MDPCRAQDKINRSKRAKNEPKRGERSKIQRFPLIKLEPNLLPITAVEYFSVKTKDNQEKKKNHPEVSRTTLENGITKNKIYALDCLLPRSLGLAAVPFFCLDREELVSPPSMNFNSSSMLRESKLDPEVLAAPAVSGAVWPT